MSVQRIYVIEIFLVLTSNYVLSSSLSSTSNYTGIKLQQNSSGEHERNISDSNDVLVPRVLIENSDNEENAFENTEELLTTEYEIESTTHSDTNYDHKEILFRKCCPKKHYYNDISNDCQIATEDIFELYVHQLFPDLQSNRINTFSKILTECPNGQTSKIINVDNSMILLQSGLLYDGLTDNLYNSSSFCLELIGNDLYSSILTTIFCKREDDEHLMYANKCCPDGHFLRDSSCLLVSNDTNESINFPKLRYSIGFLCENYVEAEINIVETYFSKGQLCLSKYHNCYSSPSYCIDNISPEGNSTTAFVCPDDVFVNKCCPENQNMNEEGCSPTNQQSLVLTDLSMRNNFKIHSLDIADCDPVLIEDDAKSNISWYYDSAQHNAVIMINNKTFKTKNYCIDDFSDDGSLIAILKVCSQEVGVYHAVESIDKFPNALGKCCPINMAYREIGNNTQCEIQNETEASEILDPSGSYKLLYAGIPTCNGNETYFKYFLNNSTEEDYGEITNNGFLSVVLMENGCKIKETLLKKDTFCLEHLFSDGEYVPAAYVCVPKGYNRGHINLILIGFSCTALMCAFFGLVSTRVRRGMVTMRKVNTLAGKILLSYVISIFIGYLALGVGVVADPKENVGKCYIIVGFILFFSVAGFCWNTSICVEGLLLTLNVRMDENLRYILHSLWAWGTSGLITTIALVMDANSEQLDCDSITPRIGREMCFFSDPMAAFLYFYLPISLTVLLNTAVLIAAKYIRISQLKKLGNIGETKSTMNKTQTSVSKKKSGLRIHQTKSTWMDTLKLVLWSGTTWLTEILGTVYASYRSKTEPEWYGYIFYIPVVFNFLRGVGVSIIILLTPENKSRLVRLYRSLNTRLSPVFHTNIERLRGYHNKTRNVKVSPKCPESRRDSLSDLNLTDLTDIIDVSNQPTGSEDMNHK